jgi:methionyl-tRNA formyltransferase
VLAALLAAPVRVAAVVVPAPPGPGTEPIARLPPPPGGRRLLPLRDDALTVVDLASQQGVPVFGVTGLGAARTRTLVASFAPDVLTVGCFPHRLPPALLAVTPRGGLNVHPSLLPAGRGPAPRFWTFRHSLERTGVTVHLMTDQLDAGPIVAQAAFDVPIGLTADNFDDRAGRLGGHLLVDAVLRVVAGVARPVAQDERRATYDPAPAAADYIVLLDGSARAAYRFIAGVAGDGGPLTLMVNGERLAVRDAVTFTETGELGSPWQWRDGELWVQCRPGVLAVRLVSDARAGQLPFALAGHR